MLCERIANRTGTQAHRLEIFRAGNMRKLPPTGLEQVLSSQLCALRVVSHHAQRVGAGCLREGIENGDVRSADGDRRARIDTPAGDDDTVDLLGQQGSDVLSLSRRVVPCIAEKYRNACSA